jgi:hypothetical protein
MHDDHEAIRIMNVLSIEIDAKFEKKDLATWQSYSLVFFSLRDKSSSTRHLAPFQLHFTLQRSVQDLLNSISLLYCNYKLNFMLAINVLLTTGRWVTKFSRFMELQSSLPC